MFGAASKQPPAGDGPAESRPVKYTFNVAAKPFRFPAARSAVPPGGPRGDGSDRRTPEPVAYIGPTRLPVNTRIWSSISSYSLEDIARAEPPPPPPPSPPRPVEQRRQLVHVLPGNEQSAAAYCKPPLHHVSCPSSALSFGPFVLASGIIQLRLRDSILVEMTLHGSVKVVNQKKSVAIAVSGNGTATAMSHPNGVVFQNGPRMDIAAYDAKKQNNFIRYAKIWHKGISLTSEGCALIYLVDSAGTRTTSDMITMDRHSDYVNQVFLNGVVCGGTTQNMPQISQVLRRSSFELGQDGSVVFKVNNFRITQAADGLVKLFSPGNQCTVRTSPTNGCATVTTPGIHCTASLGATSHLFVRHEERRMHFDGSVFIVRNAGHSAGFDEFNRLRVY